MARPKNLERSKNRARLVAFAAVTGAVATAAVVATAWPGLMCPEPPLEATAGADGVQIRLVAPPKAAVPRSGPLDVGLSDAALAMAKGRETPPPMFTSPPAPAPAATTPLLAVDDTPHPPQRLADPVDDRRERERWIAQRDEARRRAQWEREQWAAEDREERAALEQERLEDRGWRDARDEDDRYDPPPVDDRGPPPDRW